MMKSGKAFRAKGFTLLEMLLVVFLMGMLAVAATAMVDNADEQQRFELTRSRLQQIRHAIVGDTSRTLNGEPVISGFVADMGRLPESIEELVELPAAGTEWRAMDITHVIGLSTVVAGQLYGGSRGPYLDVMAETSGVRAFRDGWGNPDEVGKESDFGWAVTLSGTAPNHDAISIKSYGSDGQPGGAGAYSNDYPSSGGDVLENDWSVDLSSVSPAFKVTIHGNPDDDYSNLRLYVYFVKGNAVSTTAEAFGSEPFSVQSSVTTQSFEVDYQSGGSKLPIGRLAAIVVCANGTVFDGACPGANPTTMTPHYFSLIPRAFAPPITIPWNIQ